jgi:hypothetical protein
VIISFLFRLFLFYILFIVVRTAVRTFLAYRYVKKQMEHGAHQGGQAHWFEHQQARGQSGNSTADGETIEAEYRVVNEDQQQKEQ